MAKILLLIVEDELSLAEMYAEKLKIEGFDVDVAHDGLEGFEKMSLEHPDLVIMDIMMPNLNGLEALKLAKQDPGIKRIPVIMLTNLAGTADLKTALEKGAVGYIVKSDLTPGEVVDKIKMILKTSKNPTRSKAA